MDHFLFGCYTFRSPRSAKPQITLQSFYLDSHSNGIISATCLLWALPALVLLQVTAATMRRGDMSSIDRTLSAVTAFSHISRSVFWGHDS